MYVVIWLTSPFQNKIVQVTTAFPSILAITHLAGVVFEAIAVMGVFAVDLLTGQVQARMDKQVGEGYVGNRDVQLRVEA